MHIHKTASISVESTAEGKPDREKVAQILNECINEVCSNLESRLKNEIPGVEFFISTDPA